MKTTPCLTLTVALFLLLVSLTACQTESKTSASNPVAAASTTPTTNASQSGAHKAASAQAGTLASPTAAYQTAYAARQKKDLNGLQQALSKRMLSFMADMGKEEKKTLDDELKDMMAAPLAPTSEVRNEKISGDKATLEYQNDKGKWAVMDFVKEGSDWKLTVPSGQPTITQEMPKK